MKQGADWTRIGLYAATGLVATILGVALSMMIYGTSPSSGAAGSSGQALIGGPFELVDEDGATRTEEILLGEISLVYFGFTHCPDICPTELANLVAAKDLMAEDGLTPQILFISVDPERDTPEVLKGYVDYFDPAIIGLTGAPAQVAAAARGYRVWFNKAPDPDYPEDYTVDHTTLVYAMGPQGQYLTHFDGATAPAIIAEKLREARRELVDGAS